MNEEEIKRLNAALAEISDKLKAQAERAQNEIQEHQKLSAETRKAVDDLFIQQGELQARLQTAEQLVATLEAGGSRGGREPTMGEQVTESEEFASWQGRPRGWLQVPVKAAITHDASSAGDLDRGMRIPGVVTPATRRLTIRDLLMWGRTTSSSVEFVQETGFTNNAAPVSEAPASAKPESTLTFDAVSVPVATIAHIFQCSKQILDDVPMLQSYIDGRGRYGLKLKEEAQLLLGSGVGLNINGLFTQATAFADQGLYVVDEQRIDRLRHAMLQVELAEYAVDGIVLNPIDWAWIELLKDSQFRYLFANPHMMTTPSIWGKPVIATQSMSLGDFLVGSFSMGAQGWDREDVNVAISMEDQDNFVKNMATIRIEERLALTVYRTESFVAGNFDDLSSSA